MDSYRYNYLDEKLWKDASSDSQSFLAAAGANVSQLWQDNHVSTHSRHDPGCQTISSRDFRLLERSEAMRREIYDLCRRSLSSTRGSRPGQDDADLRALACSAVTAHLIHTELRTEHGRALKKQMIRKFIWAIDKRYRIFTPIFPSTWPAVPEGGKKLYWDVIMGCYSPRSDAFCLALVPSPWIQDDLLSHQRIFADDIEVRTFSSGINGLLTDWRICQLFARGVLAIVPSNTMDVYGCPQYRVRVMDPDYPHLNERLLPEVALVVLGLDNQNKDTVKGKAKSLNSYSITFRDLDNRMLKFTVNSTNRPLDALLFWQFASAMVKLTWQIHFNDYSARLPELHALWRSIWPLPPASPFSKQKPKRNNYLTLGTTLALSHLLNSATPREPETRANNKKTNTISVTDMILALGCADFNPRRITDDERDENVHWAPVMLLANEILERAPNPKDDRAAFMRNAAEVRDEKIQELSMPGCSICKDLQEALGHGNPPPEKAWTHKHVYENQNPLKLGNTWK
ncbi:hypothetical protein B0H66DRAFT_29197 [Apodospora peruviana]|uniref:Uncharacterized protein n=1 Tax=Apodospora peruviana TaxID=516989 RepID=A0AAE0IR26_9PEZI|nr:hypothetical protein B0H66DRAFT_29197 [Apodospora peruviana]